jgi:hypothetical protein
VTTAQSGSSQTHQFQVLWGSSADFSSPDTGNSNQRQKKRQQKRQAQHG